MALHNEFGRWGEDIAVDYLVKHGYKILDRNWQIDHKEIDIVATDGDMIVFIEVKTRSNINYGAPFEAVNRQKRKNLMIAMKRYLSIHRVYLPFRFDIISIVGNQNKWEVEYLENAVSNFIY